MAYDWPPGWNESRTEKAVQQWVCDRLNVPKYAVRVGIDSEGGPLGVELDIFKPLGEKPTSDVHEVFARIAQFTNDDQALVVGRPLEKTGERTMRLRYMNVWIETSHADDRND